MPPGGQSNRFGFAIVSAATDEAEKYAVGSNVAAAVAESPCSSNPPSEAEEDPSASGPPVGRPNISSDAYNSNVMPVVDSSQSLYGRLPRLARSASMPV